MSPGSKTLHIHFVALALWISGAAFALAGFDALAADLFESLDSLSLEDRVASVNEGELQFLHETPTADVHVHLNAIDIGPTSLEDGWVSLRQCHENIDPVPSAQILFRPDGVRDLKIVSAENVGKAWVEGHTIQLEDVAEQARLCLSGESRALHALGGGIYGLRNGPFMRRFLDGFYPMRVRMTIAYPSGILVPVGNEPEEQEGFSVRRRKGEIAVDALFEGRLYTCFLFCDRRAGSCVASAPDCSDRSGR